MISLWCCFNGCFFGSCLGGAGVGVGLDFSGGSLSSDSVSSLLDSVLDFSSVELLDSSSFEDSDPLSSSLSLSDPSSSLEDSDSQVNSFLVSFCGVPGVAGVASFAEEAPSTSRIDPGTGVVAKSGRGS